ncbi:murein transglycosylase A [Staphylococcus phage CUB-A]|nr:murein transglycosylase A [Staphylococcus phage CUB-A]
MTFNPYHVNINIYQMRGIDNYEIRNRNIS